VTLSRVGFRRALPRRRIAGSARAALLDCVVSQAGLRVALRCSVSDAIVAPVALGRDEVCLVAGLRLGDAQLEAVLAHEIAHLARRDPRWFAVVDATVAVLWLQPLNWIARRQLRELAEFLCDDAVVRQTGARRPSAESLLELAVRLRGCASSVAAVGVADGASPFVRRAARLLDGEAVVATARERPVVGVVSVAGLAATSAFAPAAPVRRLAAPAGALVEEEVLVLRPLAGGVDTVQHRSASTP
jgi:beta-lactamase regulating signal transducer with metallopeptidase domain